MISRSRNRHSKIASVGSYFHIDGSILKLQGIKHYPTYHYPYAPCMVYLPTYGIIWVNFWVNVGKYSISTMVFGFWVVFNMNGERDKKIPWCFPWIFSSYSHDHNMIHDRQGRCWPSCCSPAWRARLPKGVRAKLSFETATNWYKVRPPVNMDVTNIHKWW